MIAFEPDPIAAEKLRDVTGLNQLSYVDVPRWRSGRETGRLSLLVPDSTRTHVGHVVAIAQSASRA